MKNKKMLQAKCQKLQPKQPNPRRPDMFLFQSVTP